MPRNKAIIDVLRRLNVCYTDLKTARDDSSDEQLTLAMKPDCGSN